VVFMPFAIRILRYFSTPGLPPRWFKHSYDTPMRALHLRFTVTLSGTRTGKQLKSSLIFGPQWTETVGNKLAFSVTCPCSDVGSIPIARSINRDDSIVLTPLTPAKRPIKQGFLVPRWSQRNELVPTSQPEVGRRWTPVLAIGRQEIVVDRPWAATFKRCYRPIEFQGSDYLPGTSSAPLM